jgi:hypothetical protein
MAVNEPINLREWRPSTAAASGGRLFTCGRPGRGTFGREKRSVGDDIIDLWVKGLPQVEPLDIVSLLGEKVNGYSESSYYPFRSSKEANNKPTFQQWLDEHYHRRFVVHEFPTVDARGIPPVVREAVTRCVLDLIAKDQTVVMIDSAGAERTARVCEAIGYKRMAQSQPPPH